MDWTQFDKGVFLVNVLAVVYNPETNKVLIGKRKGEDPHLAQLSWAFIGGRPGYDRDLEEYVEEHVKRETGLDTSVERVIFAKTYPEKREFLSVYYLTMTGEETIASGEKKYEELKWVAPNEVKDYFAQSTSLHPTMAEFLETLA